MLYVCFIADGENDVMRAAHPNRAVGFENALTASQPFEIEFVIQFRAARDVPIPFIHLDHFTGVTGDAAVREEIRRIGKDGVEAAGVAVLCGDGVEQFEAIAVIQADERRVGGKL